MNAWGSNVASDKRDANLERLERYRRSTPVGDLRAPAKGLLNDYLPREKKWTSAREKSLSEIKTMDPEA